ncbi:MAG: exosortase/archaeosortase family protein [Candidatus Iainarchaeum archaeon]|uniref:Exosortase/archaeosortase family protein n=1 Tax=Candidatus Iainarchaeum sp. TaxID=3101447 RepID=A0A7T9I1Z1_9ARCH|nr:MAG: exosortase/archaeosortase family protein [Candidatus Diapherotrites archaeon]
MPITAKKKHAPTFLANPRVRTFVIRFLAVFFAFQLLAILTPLHFLQNAMAQLLGQMFSLPVKGSLLLLRPTAFDITPLCTGITSTSIWLGLLWGFKLPEKKEKIALAVWGSIAILLINFFRVMLIVHWGKTYPLAQVELAHIISWFVLSGIIIWAWRYFLMQRYAFGNGKELATELLR